MYYSENPRNFLDRLSLHNYLFPEDKYELLGFSRKENKNDGDFLFIVKQPFIESVRKATKEEIKNELVKRGFEHIKRNDYKDKDYILEDISEDNVLIDKNNNYHFIDTRLSLNTKDYGGGEIIFNDEI